MNECQKEQMLFIVNGLEIEGVLLNGHMRKNVNYRSLAEVMKTGFLIWEQNLVLMTSIIKVVEFL